MSGEEKWRYAILDSNGTVVKDEMKDDKTQETIRNFIINNLKDKNISAVVTDIDNKYPEVINDLRSSNFYHSKDTT